MCEVEVTVELKGKNIKQMSLLNKGMSDEVIKDLAEKQVIKQWSE